VTAPKLNGTTVHPSSITLTYKRYGDVLEAPNGTSTEMLRGVKPVWTVEWDSASETDFQTLMAFSRYTGTCTFTDTANATFNVVITQPGKGKISTVLPNDTYLYDMDVEFRQI